MKVTHRIPTTQYGYIEIEMETVSPEEAIGQHDYLVSCYTQKGGLPPREWTKVRKKMLETGEVDPNILDDLSPPQRWWVNETKKGLRDITSQE